MLTAWSWLACACAWLACWLSEPAWLFSVPTALFQSLMLAWLQVTAWVVPSCWGMLRVSCPPDKVPYRSCESPMLMVIAGRAAEIHQAVPGRPLGSRRRRSRHSARPAGRNDAADRAGPDDNGGHQHATGGLPSAPAPRSPARSHHGDCHPRQPARHRRAGIPCHPASADPPAATESPASTTTVTARSSLPPNSAISAPSRIQTGLSFLLAVTGLSGSSRFPSSSWQGSAGQPPRSMARLPGLGPSPEGIHCRVLDLELRLG